MVLNLKPPPPKKNHPHHHNYAASRPWTRCDFAAQTQLLRAFPIPITSSLSPSWLLHHSQLLTGCLEKSTDVSRLDFHYKKHISIPLSFQKIHLFNFQRVWVRKHFSDTWLKVTSGNWLDQWKLMWNHTGYQTTRIL